MDAAERGWAQKLEREIAQWRNRRGSGAHSVARANGSLTPSRGGRDPVVISHAWQNRSAARRRAGA
jgi:hypothetical protein